MISLIGTPIYLSALMKMINIQTDLSVYWLITYLLLQIEKPISTKSFQDVSTSLIDSGKKKIKIYIYIELQKELRISL